MTTTDQQQEPEAAAPSGVPVVSGQAESWIEIAKTIFYALLIAAAIRTILFQPYVIPSGSMEDTLQVGDYLFVSKTSYGYSVYSLPFGSWLKRNILPLDGRILSTQPKRGDILVFKLPADNTTDYIKRLIGLPGDRIQMKDGQIILNGQPVKREKVSEGIEELEGVERDITHYRETMPNGKSYDTLSFAPENSLNNTDVFVVPPGHYFMMGDNRDNSSDSRMIGSGVGYVPFENLIGKAEIIFFSSDSSARWWAIWEWPFGIRYGRIGKLVD